MRKLSRSRVTVALIYNIKEKAQQEKSGPDKLPSLSDPSPSPLPKDVSDVSPVHSVAESRPDDFYAEWDSPETINAIKEALEHRYDVIMIEADEEAPRKLGENRPDIAFNVSEGLHGVSRESQIPAVLELLRIPYLGSDPLTLGICLDKARAKEILSYHRVPTPRFTTVGSLEELEDTVLRFPAVVKPLHEGSSKGIFNASVVRTPGELRQQVDKILTGYCQPAMVEEFLPGREFTVAIMGNGDEARCLPIVEINYDSFPEGVNHVYGYEAKWVWDTPDKPMNIFTCPASLDPGLQSAIEELCLSAYRVLGCRDWSRIDVRLDRDGKPNIIEVNPLPGVLPNPEENSCFPKAARVAGMSYTDLILSVLDITMSRVGFSRVLNEAGAPVVV